MDEPAKPRRAGGDFFAKVTDSLLAMMRAPAPGRSAQVNPFQPAAHPKGAVPAKRLLAADEAISVSSDIASWAYAQLQSATLGSLETMTFLGFPALANLAQKAEYRRISETVATEMTRKWIELQAVGESGDKTEKLKKINDEFERLHVRDAFRAVAEHDGFFGRGHLYLDFGNGDNSDELATPIGNGSDNVSRNKVAKGSLKAIRVVEPVWVYPQDYSSSDPLKADFYKPQTWYVNTRRVHASRLLTFIGRPVSDLLKPAYSFGGVPMTQIAKVYVENWDKIRNAVGDLVLSFSDKGLKVDLAKALATSDQGGALQRRVDLFTLLRNNRGVMVVDKEEEFFNVTTPLGTLDELQAQAQEHMAAVSGIPLVKLLGLSPHGLNASSEGEIRVFYDWILSYQERFFTDNLRAVLGVVQTSLFGEVDPGITFRYEPLWSSSEVEKAQVRSNDAQTDKTYVDAGALQSEEVRTKITNDPESPYSGLKLDAKPGMSDDKRTETATKMATPIIQAYEANLLDKPKALEELVAAGVLKTVTPADIAAAGDDPPDLDESDLLRHVAKTKLERGGAFGEPRPAPGMPGAVPRPGERPAPQLAAANDEQIKQWIRDWAMDAAPGGAAGDPPFDLGRLTRIEAERLIRALRENDMDAVREILGEREVYRGAWDESRGFTVYHGTPFDIERFDASHEGSGTGRSVYGQGLYFADNPKIAAWYRDELSDRADLAGKPLALNAAVTNITGHVYTVHISRPREEFLDWDKPLQEQSSYVRSRAEKVLGPSYGKPLGEVLNTRGPMSGRLADAGIAGVTYLDTRKHHAEILGDKRNYVLFDPSDAKIVAKDSLALDYDPGEARDPKGTSTGGRWTKGGGGGGAAAANPGFKHHPKIKFEPNKEGEQAAAQLSWEAAPGMTTEHMPEFHSAPLAQRREFQDAIQKVLGDDKGQDIIAQRLGLHTGPTFSAAGVFQGRVNPGAQGQVLGDLSDDDIAKINAGEALRGMLLRQDAAAWHKPQLAPNGKRDPYLIPGLKTEKGVTYPKEVGKPVTHKDALEAMAPEDRKAFLDAGRHRDDSTFVFRNDKGQVLSRQAARRYAEKEGLLSDTGSSYKQSKLISEHLAPEAASLQNRLDPKDANLLDFRMGRGPSEEEAVALDKALASTGTDYALVPTPQGWRVLNVGDTPNPDFRKKVVSAIEGVESDSLPDDIDYHLAHSVGGYIANNWKDHPNAEAYREAIKQAGPDVQRNADALLSELGPKIGAVEDQFAKKYGWHPDAEHRPWEHAQGVAAGLLKADDARPWSPEEIEAKDNSGEGEPRRVGGSK